MSKGDKWRKTDFKNFYDNFDGIKFKKKKETSSEVEVKKAKGKTTYKYGL
jgi:hypothetical protein